ncbi:MAG: hypothetical protein FI725_06890 [SAR202 cluster bacterium]|nr:hypothetical protein [SAR202 cluster bacterium]|tara:strand:- start:420 stop:839 length:420 start_codon:yes stop_codon:yes gene_type:complete
MFAQKRKAGDLMKKRFVTILGLFLIMSSLALGVACSSGDTGGTDAASSTKTTLKVNGSDDFKFNPSSLTAKAGTIEIALTNTGVVDHSFVIEGKDLNIVATAGQTERGSIALTAGTYSFVCDIVGHKEAGMVGTLTITE